MSANFSPELAGYSGVEPFRFWCQKVLPLTYDDSLSYYELLCKVVNYVNHLIEDVSNAEDNIEALLTAYNELQSYVNDYFSNLDVQEEINKKLDIMASSGALYDIMAPYFQSLNNALAQANTAIDEVAGDLNVLDARVTAIASLTEGSTTGDAELIDGRVGGNGVTYSSIGDAIRAQYGINHRAIYRDDNSQTDNIILQVDWEVGAIRASDGTDLNVDTRIRTKGFLPTSAEWLLLNTDDYGADAWCYDAGGTFLGEWTSSNTIESSFTGFPSGRICIGDIYRLYPGTRVKVTIYPRGGADNPTVSTAAGFTLTSSIAKWGEPKTVRICQYNIGKFAWGGSGGLDPSMAETKIANYHDFLGEYQPDFMCMQEYTDKIDSEETYDSADIFTPIYDSVSNKWRELIIYSNNIMYRSGESYLHTSGDLPSWCVWGDCHIKGKIVRIVSGVFSTGSSLAEKKRAIDKLMSQIVNDVDNAIMSFDTNVADKAEADAIKAYLADNYSVKCANWDYFGYKDTYNLSSQMYHAIDNVMVKGDLTIRSIIVPDVYLKLSSDHFPVLVDVTVK